jgi:hypothetical protein
LESPLQCPDAEAAATTLANAPLSLTVRHNPGMKPRAGCLPLVPVLSVCAIALSAYSGYLKLRTHETSSTVLRLRCAVREPRLTMDTDGTDETAAADHGPPPPPQQQQQQQQKRYQQPYMFINRAREKTFVKSASPVHSSRSGDGEESLRRNARAARACASGGKREEPGQME